MPEPLFSVGRILTTPGALQAMNRTGDDITSFLVRHLRGDWGELCREDCLANEQGLREGLRLLSAYRLRDGTKIWVITGGDRSATTILLPDEY